MSVHKQDHERTVQWEGSAGERHCNRERDVRIEDLKVAIYADGADIEKMKQMSRLPYIRGFTTNPTLMRKAGVTDYVSFAKQALAEIPDRPVSMEVFADDFEKMEKEAREISSWGGNVFVKIPVMTTRGESSIPLIRKLSAEGLKHSFPTRRSSDLHGGLYHGAGPRHRGCFCGGD